MIIIPKKILNFFEFQLGKSFSELLPKHLKLGIKYNLYIKKDHRIVTTKYYKQLIEFNKIKQQKNKKL